MQGPYTVYPKKYAHGFVVLCFVVVMQSFIMNLYEVFIHIHQDCFAGTGAIVRLPQCQWSKPDGYEKISQCITTTKHSKAATVCIFLGIYCTNVLQKNKKQKTKKNHVSQCRKLCDVITYPCPHTRQTMLVKEAPGGVWRCSCSNLNIEKNGAITVFGISLICLVPR